MRRMSGQDAGFLHLETDESPMNTMVLAVLAPAEPVSLDDLYRHVERRLHTLPSFRWRIVDVPLGLSHPVYVEDPTFDLAYHLRRLSVAAPGRKRELADLFAGLAEQRLDDRHPRWQLNLVDGVEGGRQALVLRVQHSMLDGVAALTTFTNLFAADADVPPVPEPWHPEPMPRPGRLVLDALHDQAAELVRVPGLARRTKRNLDAVKARQGSSDVAAPEYVKDTPPCSLNDAFTRRRAYTWVRLPMADVKAVKDAAGVSLNDVALAIAGGGLRRVLLAQSDLPGRPLTASVPVSFEPPDAPSRQWGNRFSSLTTTLATDVDDPVERLRTISRVTAEAKLRHELQGAELMADWLDAIPPCVARRSVAGHQRRRRDDRSEADVNVVVSNLRGPSHTWTFAGIAVEQLVLDGPPSIGVGPNVMLWSYGDELVFGVLAFADSLPDPEALADGMHASLEELLDALGRSTVGAATVGADASP